MTPPTPTAAEIAELRKMHAAFPYHPWSIGLHGRIEDGAPLGYDYTVAEVEARRALIVAAVNALPSLLAAAEERQRLAERLREAERLLRDFIAAVTPPGDDAPCTCGCSQENDGLCFMHKAEDDARRFLAGREGA